MGEPREARKDPLEKVTYTQTPLGTKPPTPLKRPIDDILRDSRQDVKEPEIEVPKQQPDRSPKPRPVREERQPQEKITVKIAEDLVERLKNAAFWSHMPLAEIVEEGIAIAVKKIEAKNGGPFKRRERELKAGRPLGPAKS